MTKDEIAFKESSKTREQYFRDKDGDWVKTNENMINSLWLKWMESNSAKSQYKDKEGYTVYEYNN